MCNDKEIVLAVDYHDNNLAIRWFNRQTGEERTFKRPTGKEEIKKVADEAKGEAGPGGRVTWIMESMTGWASTTWKGHESVRRSIRASRRSDM